MSEIQNNEPKIVSVQMLKKFKEHFLTDLGITSANKSLIHTDNTISKVAKSVIIGEGHSNLSGNTIQNAIVVGFRNILSTNNQAIFGEYNNANNSLFVVGNGTSSNRHNAFEVTRDGVVLGGSAFNITADGAEVPANDDALVPLKYLNFIYTDIINTINTAATGETTETFASTINNAVADTISNQLANLNLPEHVTGDLYNKIDELSKSISYLISRLTVAELNEDGEPIKYFAVGLSDAALDFDTEVNYNTESSNESAGGTD